MERKERRVTVDLPDDLLAYVNAEIERRGMSPKKKSIILLEALTKEYKRSQGILQVSDADALTRADPAAVRELVRQVILSDPATFRQALLLDLAQTKNP